MLLRFDEPQVSAPKFTQALSISGSGREWSVLCNGGQAELIASVSGLGARVVSDETPSLHEIFVARAGEKLSV
jgi:ABC-2 type transport system ATP-binding protein